MYRPIRNEIESVLQEIGQDHVNDYDYLMTSLNFINVAEDIEYQKKYRNFWVMRYISPESEFNKKYFEYLEKNKNNSALSFAEACDHFDGVTTDKAGEKSSFQFSFITKLMHMIDGIFPIYDSKVRDFYFIPENSAAYDEKKKASIALVDYLRYEQKEANLSNEISESICYFRKKFSPSDFSDQKILDSLIWGYVKSREKRITRHLNGTKTFG
ncbi:MULTISPECIES: hypothetical protein [unclassified Vibrio]|uniref:hypothetical protein n=1 Tax=unclassified Vibrio TaxID=2614977 RepID=UPI00159EA273|nr:MULTISPECIES: hypothetical protein [unclassified Vibrio]NVN80951.1 hypothetical protein [Vibrio sp. Scap16]QLE95255.1 hypothetical protein FLM53_19865 [Vibrio sp. Scap24]